MCNNLTIESIYPLQHTEGIATVPGSEQESELFQFDVSASNDSDADLPTSEQVAPVSRRPGFMEACRVCY